MEVLVFPVASQEYCFIHFCSPVCEVLDACIQDGPPACPQFQG